MIDGLEPETDEKAFADIRTFWAILGLGVIGFGITTCPFVFFEIPRALLIIPIVYLIGFGGLVVHLFYLTVEPEPVS